MRSQNDLAHPAGRLPRPLWSARPSWLHGLWIALVLGATVPASAGLIAAGAAASSRPEHRVIDGWTRAAEAPWSAMWGGPPSHRALVWCVLVLVGCWLGLLSLVGRDLLPRRWSRVALALWCLPFVLTPPLFSRDAYAYVAQGLLVGQGGDPYRTPVASLLGHTAALAAVDPVWRGTLTPYGPVGLRLEQLATAVGTSEAWALVCLRLLAVGGVLVTVLCVRAMLSPDRRALGTWLALSPVLVISLLGGMHLDAVVLALLTLGMLLARRGHPLLAVVPLVTAGEIKATAFLALGVLGLSVWDRRRPRELLQLAGVALLTLACCSLAFLGDPFGWVAALGTPGRSWNPLAPATSAALTLSKLGLVHGNLARSPALHGLRLVAASSGALAGVAVLLTSRRRPLPTTTAYLLLLACAAAPTFWPWYLAACLPLLVLDDRESARTAAVVLGACGALLALPLHALAAQRLGVSAELAMLVLVGLAAFQRARQPPGPTRPVRSGTAALWTSAPNGVTLESGLTPWRYP